MANQNQKKNDGRNSTFSENSEPRVTESSIEGPDAGQHRTIGSKTYSSCLTSQDKMWMPAFFSPFSPPDTLTYHQDKTNDFQLFNFSCV